MKRPDSQEVQHQLRQLPKVDELLSEKELAGLAPRPVLTQVIRERIDALRKEILSGEKNLTESWKDKLYRDIATQVQDRQRPYMRRVINGTGIILHTGLGRAVLAEEVRRALAENSGYMMLEIEQDTGLRGVRETSISELLCRLTGAEAATVVNNNAAATMITLATLAQGREVICSRGQLVEIGGSYRIPDVMEQSGCILREVGCTNKTHPRDYERAVTDETALLLEVHTSNYRIVGFHREVTTEELVAIGRSHQLPVYCDLGSGNLVDLKKYGFMDEPTVQEKLAAGVDVATFSGDKLLGASQGGIIVGKKEVVEKIRAHQLFRALRPGKLDLIALERTLQIYLDPDHLEDRLPTLHMLSRSARELRERGNRLMAELEDLFSREENHLSLELAEVHSQIGSGALPIETLPSIALVLTSEKHSPDDLSKRLRMEEIPVFNRIQEDRVILDLRTIQEEDEPLLVKTLHRLL